MRWLLATSLLLAACGAPPRRVAPRVVVIDALPRTEAEPRPSLDARVDAARAEVAEEATVDVHRSPIDGEARLHLVLDRGHCYRVWVGTDRAVDARLEDEHGNAVARGAGWLPEICPRWTGSFRLVVTPREHARDVAVLVAARPL